ncbi:MAG: aminotransferase class V-fold PLP-dependent enzyme [Ruminiclostridium sp.]|nr:aminotransferase class V-fold PLP-dependent enzyme [Ruminiclostridium sp.]
MRMIKDLYEMNPQNGFFGERNKYSPMNTPIHDFLISYGEKNSVRCHMPGGKSNPFDITEIEGADSLFESAGIIRESEESAAKLFGAGKTLFSCGGSTLSVQTMLALAKAYRPEKKRVIASRYCHKSLISACVLLGLVPDWIYPEEYLSCKIAPEAVKAKITSDTLCVFAQSIDYYGGESDVEGIAEACREKNVPLLTDNAHGAYLVFTDRHPLALGADMTADSAHKTLPCLTGGAYLHINKNAPEIFIKEAKAVMSLFGSSSPSYLILDSLDMCNNFIQEEREKAKRIFAEVKSLKSELVKLGYTLKESDLMRITVDALPYGYSGAELGEELRKNGVESEFSDDRYTVLLFSCAQRTEDFERIIEAAKGIKPLEPLIPVNPPIVRPIAAAEPREAMFSAAEVVPLEKAEGRICADINTPCPPCVPVVMAGEIIDGEIVRALERYGVKRIRICSKG